MSAHPSKSAISWRSINSFRRLDETDRKEDRHQDTRQATRARNPQRPAIARHGAPDDATGQATAPAGAESLAKVTKAATAAKARVGKLKQQEIQLSYVGAGGAGLGASFPLMHLILTRGWMTPGWAGLALAVLCTVGAYFGFKSGKPHVATATLGLGVGCGAIGGWTSLQAARMRAMAAKQAAKKQQRSAADAAEDTRNASESSSEYGRYSAERLSELEAELEAARRRLADDVELAVAAA